MNSNPPRAALTLEDVRDVSPALEKYTQRIAFYAGWPNVFSAIPVANGVFEARE